MSPEYSKSKQELQVYISRISPVFKAKEIGDYADTSHQSVRRWQRAKNAGTDIETTRSLGVLAATIKFLETELSFSEEYTRTFLNTVHIDTDTGEPMSGLDYIKAGNTPKVISSAIELSIDQNF